MRRDDDFCEWAFDTAGVRRRYELCWPLTAARVNTALLLFLIRTLLLGTNLA